MSSSGHVRLQEVLESAMNLAAPEIERRGTLVREFEATPPVRGDASRLVQAFFEVLVAAGRALPVGAADDHAVRVVLRPAGLTRAAVEVHDTAPDRAPDQDPRLMRARGIVADLGGELQIEMEPGRGSCVHVFLPLASADAPAPTPSAAESQRGNVLVVEDDADVAEVIAQSLRGLHNVTWIADANDALTRIGEGDRFDVILCDLLMPEFDGTQLHAALVRIAPDQAARMVFMSGSTLFPRGNRFLAENENHFLEKPFSIRALRALIVQVMRESAASSP